MEETWDIRREGRRWTHEESQRRLYEAPEKIEFVGGIFAGDHERLKVLGMLLELLGIDRAIQFGNLSDWKAAVLDREGALLSCERALRVAHTDAAVAYRDLSGYRIEMSLENDGWHVDYKLKDVQLHGGGPHYIIDAITGTILTKRYEQ